MGGMLTTEPTVMGLPSGSGPRSGIATRDGVSHSNHRSCIFCNSPVARSESMKRLKPSRTGAVAALPLLKAKATGNCVSPRNASLMPVRAISSGDINVSSSTITSTLPLTSASTSSLGVLNVDSSMSVRCESIISYIDPAVQPTRSPARSASELTSTAFGPPPEHPAKASATATIAAASLVFLPSSLIIILFL